MKGPSPYCDYEITIPYWESLSEKERLKYYRSKKPVKLARDAQIKYHMRDAVGMSKKIPMQKLGKELL